MDSFGPRRLGRAGHHNGRPQNNAEKFWRRVVKTDACWLWGGPFWTRTGYGRFKINYQDVVAHRFAYEDRVGPVPDGMMLTHGCDNRRCVRPHRNHVRPGTQTSNMQEMVQRGRSLRGEKNPASKLTREQADEIRRRALAGEAYRVLAAEFGVTYGLVGHIKRGRLWREVTE